MALLDKILKVKKSGLPGAGKGLFTTGFIPEGTRITEYKGKIKTWKEAKKEDGENNYIFYLNRNHVIDAKPRKKSLARYANDARGVTRVKGVKNNSIYSTEGLKVYIEAIRDIPPGEEILVDYGKEYWEVTRENKRLDKKEKETKRRKEK
jgi:SET domain-containing protein